MEHSIYLSDTAVARRYGIGRATVWRWTQENKLPKPTRFSPGCTRWRLADLEEWEQSRNKGAA